MASPTTTSFQIFILRTSIGKLSYPNLNLQGECWESVLLITSVSNNQASQRNLTIEQANCILFTKNALLLLSVMCPLPALCFFHLWLVTYTYLLFRIQLIYHLISLSSILSYVCIFLISIALWDLRNPRRSLIHSFIHSPYTYGISTLCQAVL